MNDGASMSPRERLSAACRKGGEQVVAILDQAARLRYQFLLACVVGLVLLLPQALLQVPSGYGVEDFLGWSDPELIRTIRSLWSQAGVSQAAWIYLAVDTVLFLPAYAALLLELSRVFVARLAHDGDRKGLVERVLLGGAGVAVVALVLVDMAENFAGFVRLDLAPAGLLTTLVAALLVRGMSLAAFVDEIGWAPRVSRAVTAAVTAGLLLVGILLFGAAKWQSTAVIALGAWAHAGKTCAILTAMAVPLVAPTLWFFGARLQPDPGDAAARAAGRAAVFDIVVRSRYVLLALALLAGVLLFAGQGSDVLYGMAQAFIDGRPLAAVGVMALSLAALVLMSYACWFWTRSVCQIRSATTPADRADAEQGQAFARYWARVLSMVPFVLLLLVCCSILSQAAAAAAHPGPHGRQGLQAALLLLVFTLVCVAAGVWFLFGRGGANGTYYDALDWTDWCHAIGLAARGPAAPSARYTAISVRGVALVRPRVLPYVLAALLLLCKLAVLLRLEPSVAFPLSVLSIALWLCFFGWLSILEVQRSVPWVGLLVLGVGLVSAAGWSHNHAVRAPAAAPIDPLPMWVTSAALVAVLLVAYHLMLRLIRARLARRQAAGTGAIPGAGPQWPVTIALVVGVAAAVTAVIRVQDSQVPPRLGRLHADDTRKPLDLAMQDWLHELCSGQPGCRSAQKDEAPPAAGEARLKVFFVTTEGGGIRAAAWTAWMLQNLSEREPGFLQRTFSISGVSGGSVGAAAFRACAVAKATAGERKTCLDRWARTDHLSPLLGALLFEDPLARIYPTDVVCNTPGCGSLSRGQWFEGSLEGSLPSLHQGLIASREQLATAGHHPYLFLNATWVESGERAIASDVQIGWPWIRGAKDQLRLVGHDVSLATAAHNSARFPFVNAIGALRAPAERCLERSPVALPWQPRHRVEPQQAGIEVCGHLADGGYHDNSGGQTTVDILAAFAACVLTVDGADTDCRGGDGKATLTSAQRAWLRGRLLPQVLMLRNGVDPAGARLAACPDPERKKVGAEELDPVRETCGSLADGAYFPHRPLCRPSASTYVDALGPLLTVVNVSGVGANGRVSEARQWTAVEALRLAMGHDAPAAKARADEQPVRVYDLLPEGMRFPLGWHLSPASAAAIERQASACVKPAQRDIR